MGIMKDYFLEKYNHWIHRPGSDKLLQWLETTDFFTAPASTRFHLAQEGGLVEHSVHVYDRLQALFQWEFTNGAMPTRDQNESIAICGLLNDVCKVNVYQQEPKNRKTYDPAKVAAAESWQVKHDALGDFVWETVMGYKFEDSLPYDHGEKSVYIISGFMRLTREEAMAIRFTLEVPRLCRSTKQLCEIIDMVRDKHLRLIIMGSITMDCRTGQPDPMTEAFLQIAGVFAQLELSMIRSRVRSGMANAKAKGKHVGRPPMSEETIPDTFFRYYSKYQTGEINVSELARLSKLSRSTVYRYINILEGRNQGRGKSSMSVGTQNFFDKNKQLFLNIA